MATVKTGNRVGDVVVTAVKGASTTDTIEQTIAPTPSPTASVVIEQKTTQLQEDGQDDLEMSEIPVESLNDDVEDEDDELAMLEKLTNPE